ncbi:tryptophan synthase subunit alpha [Staphylococcus saccharolyticus]
MVAGFGIKNYEHVKEIGKIADGVVIDSEIVRRLEKNQPQEFIQYIKTIRQTLDIL